MVEYSFIDGALFIPDERLLVLADIHIGYEAELRKKGVLIPTNDFSLLQRRIQRILVRTNPATVVLNGDLKHGFGSISDTEWRHLKQLFELFKDCTVVLVGGNHDPLLPVIAERFGHVVRSSYTQGGVLCVHGDVVPDVDVQGLGLVVIGHVHPAVTIRGGVREELVKCYVEGFWRGVPLVVLPSMFSLTEGVDVLSEERLGPFLDDIQDFVVSVLSAGEVLRFGTVREVSRLGKG